MFLQVRILNELWMQFSEVQILKGLRREGQKNVEPFGSPDWGCSQCVEQMHKTTLKKQISHFVRDDKP